jgi:hypothetical protein
MTTLTIALTFLNSMFLPLVSMVIPLIANYFSSGGQYWLQITERFLKALSTTVVIILLFDTILLISCIKISFSLQLKNADGESKIRTVRY